MTSRPFREAGERALDDPRDCIHERVQRLVPASGRLPAEPFDTFEVHPMRIAVFHLGNTGAARKLLKAWTLTR